MISVVAWKSDLSKVWMKTTSKPHFNRKWQNDPCLSRHTRCLGYEEANLLEKDLVSPLVRWKLIVAAFLSRLVLLLLWWSRFVNVDVAVEVVSKLLFLLSWQPFCPGRTFCQSKTFLSRWNQIVSILYQGIINDCVIDLHNHWRKTSLPLSWSKKRFSGTYLSVEVSLLFCERKRNANLYIWKYLFESFNAIVLYLVGLKAEA